MDEEKREKLEKELQFLKDSLSSGIISQEEFSRGESRIQGQLIESDDASSEEGAPQEESREIQDGALLGSSTDSEVAQAEPGETEEKAAELKDEKDADGEDEKDADGEDEKDADGEDEKDADGEDEKDADGEDEKDAVPEEGSVSEEIHADSEDALDVVKENLSSKEPKEEDSGSILEPEVFEDVAERSAEDPVGHSEEGGAVPLEIFTTKDQEEKKPPEKPAEKILDGISPQGAEDGASVKEDPDAVQEKPDETDVPLTEVNKTEPVYVSQEGAGRSSFGKYIIIMLILGAGLFMLLNGNPFGDRSGMQDNPIDLLTSSPSAVEPACHGDGECSKDKMIGKCEDAGTRDASCTFTEDTEVHLTIVEDPSCVLCDSTRMEQTLKEVFPNLVVTRIAYDSEAGRDIALRQDVALLPAYFVANDVEQATHFNLFARALEQTEGGYFVGPKASGASFFIGREEKPEQLTVFVSSDVRTRTLNNIQPVLDLFGDNIRFTERSGGSTQFAVSTYPTFIVNNKIRFSGIHAPEKIKENYCLLNDLAACSTLLTSQIS